MLTQELGEVQENWYEIGMYLGLDISVNDIRREYSDPGVCLKLMLKKQLKRVSTTWRNIVDTLRSPGVGESQLADQLEAKYCPSEFFLVEYIVIHHYS